MRFETGHPSENNRVPPYLLWTTGGSAAAGLVLYSLLCGLPAVVHVSVTESELVLTGPGPVSVTDLQTVAPSPPVFASSFPQALSVNAATPRARLDICGQQIEMQVVNSPENDGCLSAGLTQAGKGGEVSL